MVTTNTHTHTQAHACGRGRLLKDESESDRNVEWKTPISFAILADFVFKNFEESLLLSLMTDIS